MGRIFTALLVLGCLLAQRGTQAQADRPVTSFIFQRDVGDVNDYAWKVLREALDRTVDKYGPYSLKPSPAISGRPRPVALANHELGINVNVFPDSPAVGEGVIPVPIPVDRGMLGYRVLLIREADQGMFDAVGSLDQLKALRFGSLTPWVDADIMRDAGLTVVTGYSYDGLFRMLMSSRFDGLNRSVTEIQQEYARLKGQMPGLAIERGLLLHYPIPSYFWVANSSEGRHMAERIHAGLMSMVDDGTLEARFNAEFGQLIAQLDLAHRRVIELPNRTLLAKAPLDDPRLWYRPVAFGGP